MGFKVEIHVDTWTTHLARLTMSLLITRCSFEDLDNKSKTKQKSILKIYTET